jgi:dihydrolipoamide dehydrogenase
VIATGSIPNSLKSTKGLLDSNDVLSLKRLPKSMAIVGGGIIGVEMACLFNILGSKVSIFEREDRLLWEFDKELSDAICSNLRKNGISVSLGQEIDTKDLRSGFQNVLTCVGRRPLITDDITDLGIKTGPKGYSSGMIVDKRMRSNIRNIYAIGDVTGRIMLAHVAMQQAMIAADSILGGKNKIEYNELFVPVCVYTIPEIAMVGAREDQVEKPRVYRTGFASNARARCEDNAEGFVKIVCDQKNRIMGIHIFGENATELIQNGVHLIGKKYDIEELRTTIHAHPTYSELFWDIEL